MTETEQKVKDISVSALVLSDRENKILYDLHERKLEIGALIATDTNGKLFVLSHNETGLIDYISDAHHKIRFYEMHRTGGMSYICDMGKFPPAPPFPPAHPKGQTGGDLPLPSNKHPDGFWARVKTGLAIIFNRN